MLGDIFYRFVLCVAYYYVYLHATGDRVKQPDDAVSAAATASTAATLPNQAGYLTSWRLRFLHTV